MSTKDIEKENLEAHVELCSERYKQLHDKLDAINSRLDKNESTLVEIHKAVTNNESNRNKQILAWRRSHCEPCRSSWLSNCSTVINLAKYIHVNKRSN